MGICETLLTLNGVTVAACAKAHAAHPGSGHVELDGCVKQVEARKVRSNGSPSHKPKPMAREKDTEGGLPLGLASLVGFLVA